MWMVVIYYILHTQPQPEPVFSVPHVNVIITSAETKNTDSAFWFASPWGSPCACLTFRSFQENRKWRNIIETNRKQLRAAPRAVWLQNNAGKHKNSATTVVTELNKLITHRFKGDHLTCTTINIIKYKLLFIIKKTDYYIFCLQCTCCDHKACCTVHIISVH